MHEKKLASILILICSFYKKSKPKTAAISRLNETSLFAEIISLCKSLQFQKFSSDGEYLKIQYIDDMLDRLGGPEDDYLNHFTARMLLLLESQPLVNAKVYQS